MNTMNVIKWSEVDERTKIAKGGDSVAGSWIYNQLWGWSDGDAIVTVCGNLPDEVFCMVAIRYNENEVQVVRAESVIAAMKMVGLDPDKFRAN